MAGHQLMRGGFFTRFGKIFRQLIFFLRFQHGEFFNVIEIARQAAFRIGGGASAVDGVVFAAFAGSAGFVTLLIG